MLRDAGSSVTVVFLTSGSASHPNSKSHPPKTLAKLRESEAIKACLELGVPESDIHFVRAADSRLEKLDQQSKADIIERITTIFKSANIASLAMPWRRLGT